MKKLFCLISFFLVTLTLAGCGQVPEIPETTVPEITTPPPTTALPETTPPETTAATEPAHSAFYIPGLSVEDLILYFNEVCLDAEFVNSGNPSLLQKWDTPIYYCIQGSPTQEDQKVLGDFVRWLNSIPGFPGMYETHDPWTANLDIHFCTQSEMLAQLGNQFDAMDGGVTFWYDGENRIYDATICYRTEIDQYLRNSVILEEIYNGLGPVQDTLLRPDSIIASDYSTPQELTEIDKLILTLLYHPDLLCGMDADACAHVIRQLYY